MFRKATKSQSFLRMALIGVAGSGKTYTALSIASHLKGPVAMIDSEHGSSEKYADLFAFDVCRLDRFSDAEYIGALREAQSAGYGTIIIDSASHFWQYILNEVDRLGATKYKGNNFSAWKDVTPIHQRFVEAFLSTRAHVILTFRAKQEYVLETNERGKQTPVKRGIGAVARDGIEYEADIVAELDLGNTMRITKSRCPALSDATFHKPGGDVADILRSWLSDGAPIEDEPAASEDDPSRAPELDPHSAEVIAAVERGPAGHDVAAEKRDKRARALAAAGHVVRTNDAFEVTTTGRRRETYRVWRDRPDTHVRCSCPEHAEATDRRFRCEHILAVKYHLEPPAEDQPTEEEIVRQRPV